MTENEHVRRTSCRVIVLEGESVLLIGSDGTDTGQLVWVVPGGGREAGESDRAAAIRELWEETGMRVDPASVHGPVASTHGSWTNHRGTTFDDETVFFAVWVSDRPPIDFSGLTRLENEVVREARWWTPSELDETLDTVYPRDLSGLVRHLLLNLSLIHI